MRADLLRTQSFRIVLIYVFLFAVSATAIIGFTYWNTRRALDAQTDQTIEAEVTGLNEQYQRLGVRGLAEVLVQRSLHAGQGLYLLVNQNRQVLAGNLDTWPDMVRTGNFVEFQYQLRVGNAMESRIARGRVFPLAGNFVLLVARDVHERYLTLRFFTTTLPWTVGLILALGLVGGAFLSRNMLNRLDSINSTSAEIIAGDFTRRVTLSGRNDEFDALAENFNRMLDRIERLMSGVREVTDSVAHDLRTPLNRLRNRLDMMLRHLNTSNEGAEIEAAIQETDRLIATFNALLLIAETDSGVRRGAMAPLDISRLAADVVEFYAPVAEEKGVGLAMRPQGVTMVHGNASLISQALANLIDNAIKYTPQGGKVMVRVEDGDGAALSVADTGPGIPVREHARVTERFVRLEESRSTPGSGLGLSLVAAVARLHDATLDFSDNAPGLRATLRFPRPPRASSQPAAPVTV